MNDNYLNDLKTALNQVDSSDGISFYKENEVLIKNYSNIVKEFNNWQDSNLFSETKINELRRQIPFLTNLDFKIKRIKSKTFSKKYKNLIDDNLLFAKTEMLLSQAEATLIELNTLLEDDKNEQDRLKQEEENIVREETIIKNDEIKKNHELNLKNLQKQSDDEKRKHDQLIHQIRKQGEEKSTEQERIFKKQLKELEIQRLDLNIEVVQFKTELKHFQDLQNTKISLENSVKLKEFRKSSFLESVVNDWISAFQLDNKFKTQSLDFYDNLFNKEILVLKDIVNIPSSYSMSINSDNILPLIFFNELKTLFCERVNLCFLPFLVLPKLSTLKLQDCYYGCNFSTGKYLGNSYKFEETNDWIIKFKNNNPNCRVVITT